MRFLDKNKIDYEIQVYQCDEFIDGITVANALGQPLEETFKTLVAKGKSGNYYCFLIPVALGLDLKKAAKSVDEKSVELIHVKDINKITGYVRGGCTPIGMKKQFMTVASIEPVEEFVMNATLEPAGAFANFSISCSFSSISLENSGVLK